MIERLAVGILATWFFSAQLYYGYGPGDMFRKTREAVNPEGFLAHQFDCFWCVATWMGLALTPFTIWLPWLLVPFALAGATMLLSGGGRIIWRELTQ